VSKNFEQWIVNCRFQANSLIEAHCWSQFGFLAVGRQPGHYTRFGVTPGWAVIQTEPPEFDFQALDSRLGDLA